MATEYRVLNGHGLDFHRGHTDELILDRAVADAACVYLAWRYASLGPFTVQQREYRPAEWVDIPQETDDE